MTVLQKVFEGIFNAAKVKTLANNFIAEFQLTKRLAFFTRKDLSLMLNEFVEYCCQQLTMDTAPIPGENPKQETPKEATVVSTTHGGPPPVPPKKNKIAAGKGSVAAKGEKNQKENAGTSPALSNDWTVIPRRAFYMKFVRQYGYILK